jgi:two-component system response regulator RegX3
MPEGSQQMPRILVVEDEEAWSEPLSFMLRREGFEVAVAATGPQALVEFDHNGADLVLLDLMLPQMPGVEVCHELRARRDVPIIMVSARDSEVDKVVGLEIGADDYVTKPCSMRELLARIRAVLRRRTGHGSVEPSPVLAVGPVRMEVDRHLVTVRGAEVGLTLKEFDLLEVLLRNTGRVLTRRQLVDRVWGPRQAAGDARTLDVHIKRLRTKIEADPAAPRHITTVRGIGYKFQS